MSYLDPTEAPQARVSPALMMGAASPLWGYFGAAAASGLAFWWMTRWTRPVNLEALFATATDVAAPMLEPMIEAVEVMAEIVADEPETLVAAAMALAPEPEVAAEALTSVDPVIDAVAEPVEAVVEAAAEPLETLVEASPDLEPEPAFEPVTEPVALAEALPATPAAALAPQAPLKARPKKTAPPATEPEA